jgi:hypothetical protein
MIMRTRQYLFVFVTNRDIPSTNNGSERALRPCAVFRKITNGFRTEWRAKLYADIRSVIEPHAAVPSEPSKQSASPWRQRPWRSQHSRRKVSNYSSWHRAGSCRSASSASDRQL